MGVGLGRAGSDLAGGSDGVERAEGLSGMADGLAGAAGGEGLVLVTMSLWLGCQSILALPFKRARDYVLVARMSVHPFFAL